MDRKATTRSKSTAHKPKARARKSREQVDTTTEANYRRIVGKLLDRDPRHSKQDYMCPAHDDGERPSLGVKLSDDKTRVLVYCQGGCETEDVLRALGEPMSALFGAPAKVEVEAKYDYTDEDGKVLFQVVRCTDKSFRQRRPIGGGRWVWNLEGVRRVPYHLPRVLEAIERGDPVYVVEGEKDVEAIEKVGGYATCNPGGAGRGRWRDGYSELLRDAEEVRVVADLDGPKETARESYKGERHAMAVAASLVKVGVPVRLVQAREGKDAADHLAAGLDLDDLDPFVEPPTVDGEADTEHQSDTGNARRLVALHGDRIRYCLAHRAWYIWDGRIWKRDVTLEMMRLAKATVRTMLSEAVEMIDKRERDAAIRWCIRSESTASLRAMIDNAASEVAVEPTAFNANKLLLCVENGTLDLQTGKLRPHDPTDLITLLAPVEYDRHATDPRFEDLLDRFIRPDDGKEEFLQRAAFESLTGTITSKAFINLFDSAEEENESGNTGKTSFVESLLATLGPYGTIVNADSFLANFRGGSSIRSDLADCDGRRMVVSSEIPAGRKLDIELMKKLTAGLGKYRFERKHENSYENDWTATIWLDGNTVAKARVEDNPLFDRWRLTPFRHRIAKPEKKWLEKAVASPEYRAAVLAWAMRARRAWLREGIGSAPSVEEATAEVRAAMDPLAWFWKEECRLGEDREGDRYFATTGALLQRLDYACTVSPERGRPSNHDDFVRLLKVKSVRYAKRRVDGHPTWGWIGIRLRKYG